MARKKIKNIVILTPHYFSILIVFSYLNFEEFKETVFVLPSEYKQMREKYKGIANIEIIDFKYWAILDKDWKNKERIKRYVFVLNNICHRIKLYFKMITRYSFKDLVIFFNMVEVTSPVVHDYQKSTSIFVEDGLYASSSHFPIIQNNEKKQRKNSKIYSFIVGSIDINKISKYITTNDTTSNITKPVEIINLKEKWNKSSENKKKFIFDFYNFNIDILKQYNSFSILCPQALSEDNLISEEEKIEIYRRALDTIPQNEKIVIKPHPREKTDYKKIFPNAIVISKDFPMELADIAGIKFSKIYTVYSSVALHFPNSKVVLIKVKNENLPQELIIKVLDSKGIGYEFI